MQYENILVEKFDLYKVYIVINKHKFDKKFQRKFEIDAEHR